MRTIYLTLLEVSLALRHLHCHGLVHCDVKPGNVLLRAAHRDPRGWSAKLADYGCCRLLSELDGDGRPAFRDHTLMGTYTHMAPELFTPGASLDGTVDVFALGCTMWELAQLAPLYPGLGPEQVVGLVRRGARPSFGRHVPEEYVALASLCWAQDPRCRPTAAACVNLLRQLLAQHMDGADGVGDGGAPRPPCCGVPQPPQHLAYLRTRKCSP